MKIAPGRITRNIYVRWRLRALTLRNFCLNLEQLQALQALRPKLQFMVVQSPRGGYVSHFRQDIFPWRHLVRADPGVR
ncbi:hypothetical protein A9974_00075 [Achromobacter sp. UMC71]|nr:hypothetical protein [Achromobacter sp. UMC71]